ncbi:DNRLRE domain-containing protein [Streptomyces sp. NPDC093097]|uniref:DNRLRE domain-containing protein n=1 Tax=Streptomyces sp. NPDC093097 TaxID=3366027 RepID=UPI0038168129
MADAGAVVVGKPAAQPNFVIEPAAVKSSGSAEAEDAASAALTARLQKRPIEILSERTETTTVWAQPDGTRRAEFAAGPVRFRDENGAWQDVDPTLTVGEDGTVRAKSHPLDLELAGKTPGKPDAAASRRLSSADPVAAPVPLVKLQAEEADRELTVSWRGGLPQPKLSGTKATYENALPGTDLIVESTRTGFEQYLVLKDKKAVDEVGTLRLTLDADGMKAVKQDDGSIAFTDATSGKQLGSLPAPVMWDARVDERSGEHIHRADVAMDVVESGRNIDITLTPDAKFLADEGTKFPVMVDPAVNLGTTFTTFVQEGYNTDQSGSTELKLGNNGGGQKARSFLKFNTRPIKGKKIESATLQLWNTHSWSCTARAWDVYDTDTATTATRWTSQPGWHTKWASSTQTKGFSSSCAAGWVTADIKNLMQRWADDASAENTLGIRSANESDPCTWKRFNSRNAASNVPVIAVTYNTPPATPSAVAVAPSTVNPYNNRRYVTSLTPSLSAKVTDADGGNVKAQFEVTPDPAWNDAGNYNFTATSANVSSGGTAKVTVPADEKFPAGSGLRMRVRGYDGKHYGAWSGYITFRLNTVKPTAPKVTCESFSDDTWSDNPGKDTSCTLSTTSSDGRGYLWGLDDPSTPKQVNDQAGTGGKPLNITIKPSDGWHTLYARTVDSAGLVSEKTTAMAFGVGKDGAALLQPSEGVRPARRTHLNARGKSEYKEVTFEYRRSDEDTWQTVPAGDVTFTSGDEPIGSWPQPVTGGSVKPMAWNIAKTLSNDGPLQVRATFSGADKLPDGHTQVSRITFDRDAGTAPTSEVGPGEVNLLTGNLALSETDASAFDLSVSRNANSRKPGQDTAAQGQAPIFGPSWTTGIESELSDSNYTGLRKTSNTSVTVTFEDGDEIGFSATKNGAWNSEVGAEEFTLTGSLTGSFTLTDKDGTVTVFRKTDSSLATWQVSSSRGPEENSTTRTVSEKVTVDNKDLARPKYVIAPTSAASSETCEATPATKGCRMLEFVYATSTTADGSKLGDYAGRLRQIRLWATSPGAAASTATAVSSYAYDTRGQLREQWDPRIAPALKTTYAYDDAGRVTSYTPAGELPWTLTYGKAGNAQTAGEGMLLSAARPALKQGSASEADGTAATRVVYDVPTRGDRAPTT